jgi:hypothetical protein
MPAPTAKQSFKPCEMLENTIIKIYNSTGASPSSSRQVISEQICKDAHAY